MQINIGITSQHREVIAQGLARVLADSYTLYLKTHCFHWNVTGSMFTTLHQLFETQYLELATAIDQIAERIRALGSYAPGSYQQFSQLTSIIEEAAVPKAQSMIEQLLKDQETLVRTAREVCALASEAKDDATADLLTQRMQLHEKNAWMLRSLLD
jgi:starvation-inducible DNA-binding protein